MNRWVWQIQTRLFQKWIVRGNLQTEREANKLRDWMIETGMVDSDNIRVKECLLNE